MQKPVSLLYTNNKLSERKIKETIPFTIASKRLKYLGKKSEQGGKRPVLRKLYDINKRN